MRRRRRSSRMLAVVLASLALAGAAITLYRLRTRFFSPAPLAAVDAGAAAGNPQPVHVDTNPARKPLFDGKPTLLMAQTPSEPVAAPDPSHGPDSATTTFEQPQTREVVPFSAGQQDPMAVHPAAPPTTRPVNLSGDPLADARALMAAQQPVEARDLLNVALQSDKLSAADAGTARTMMSELNHEVIFGRRIFNSDTHQGAYTIKFGDRLAKLGAANDVTWELICRINGISDPRRVRAGQTLKVIRGPFNAVVNKSSFTMDIYLGMPGETGSLYVMSFPVGLGKDDSTPPGTWLVQPHRKLKNPTYYSPRGEGVIAAGDPRNPLGEYWIGLTGLEGAAVGKMSYGIHGTIDPDSVGKMESMGCIRMHNDDVALVYELLLEGRSRVLVKP